MKMIKLSLATLVAVGGFASVASATPLEESIKGVDLSGYARYRLTKDDAEPSTTHNFKVQLGLKTPVSDNLQVVGVAAVSSTSDANKVKVGRNANTRSSFQLKELYGVGSFGDTSVLFGLQTIGAFFTDDMKGIGLKVLNTSVPGWTFAAVAFDNLENDDEILSDRVKTTPTKKGKTPLQSNLYGAAAIGAMGPVNGQLWVAHVEDIATMYALELAYEGDFSGVKFGVTGQFSGTAIAGAFDNVAQDGMMFGLAANVGVSGFDFQLGYTHVDPDNKGATAISFEDNGGFLKAGEQSYGYNLVVGDKDAFFLVAGANIDKFFVGADFVYMKTDTGATRKDKEYVLRLGYKYNKNWNFKSYFSRLDPDVGKDRDKIRFEAKYSF